MRNFNEIHIKPMIFKNLSSDFSRNILHSMGLIEIYPVVRFAPENRADEKPMIRFVKILKGELLCTSPLLKTRYCVCRRFLPSFPSAEAHGGPDAKADAFPNPSKSVPGHQRGAVPIFSRFWKKSPVGKRENDRGQCGFVFPILLPAFFTFLRKRADGRKAIFFQPHQGP
jgi:hypothetical protein